MRTRQSMLFGILLALAVFARPAEAAPANCHCQYLVNGTDVDTTQKPGYNQIRPKDRIRCENHCKAELDARKGEMARKLPGACGNVTVRVLAWVGTWKPHKDIGAAQVDVPCGPGKPGTDGKTNQYAVKFVCGLSSPATSGNAVVAPGSYLTAINVHNPQNKPIALRKKFALALPGKEGPISPWVNVELGPDGALEIDCPEVHEWTRTQAFAKGFAVLETRSPEDHLDVVAVYTAGREHVETLHTERVPARLVVPAPEAPRCGGDLRTEVISNAQWVVTAAPPGSNVTVPTAATVVQDPIWGAGPWISAGQNSQSTGVAGRYTYEHTFCLCEGFSSPQLSLLVRADNSAQVYLNGNPAAGIPVGSWNPGTQIPASSFQAAWFKPGQNVLRITVQNNERNTGLAVTGSLTATNGRCP